MSEIVLGEHTFSNSWGSPFVTTYSPPSEEFTHVRIKLEVSSSGIQYDRLARLYIGGSEVWRSSTAEPTGGAMSYSFTKEASRYVALFRNSQDVVFDLGNTVNDQLTGAYWTRLTLQFYYSAETAADASDSSVFDSYQSNKFATNVIPIRPKDQLTTDAYCYTLPSESINFDISPLPKNTTRVVLDIFASGNGNDEFWYFNMQPENANAFASYGFALPTNYPSRIIEVTVDDEPSGMVLPFPIIFTGGFSPSLWIPVVGVNAFDLPTYPIDITPLLPKLWNGANIKISITTGFGNLANHDWYVNANLLTWQTEGVEGSGTTVTGTSYNNTNSFSDPADTSIMELLSVSKDLSTQAILKFTNTDGSSEEAFVKSSQTMTFTNAKNFFNKGSSRQMAQVSSGHSMLHVTNSGTDLTSYRDGQQDSDAKPPSDFSVVFDDTDSDSNLKLVYEWSYIYPLAINDVSTSSGASQTDIYRGFMYEEEDELGVWTRQNSSVVSGTVDSQQYLAQRNVGPTNSVSLYEQFVGAHQYNIYVNNVGSPNVDSVLWYGETDSITQTVSNAANVAYYQKDNTDAVVSAIQNIFNTVLPSIQVSKRDVTVDSGLWARAVNTIGGLFRTPFAKRTAIGGETKFEGLGRSPFNQKRSITSRSESRFEGLGRSPFHS